MGSKTMEKEIYPLVPPRPLHKNRLGSTVCYNHSPSEKGRGPQA